MALGIIDEINEEKREMSVWTPLDEDEQIANVVPAKIRTTLEEKEMYVC